MATKKKLPPRPDLDLLRRRAKALLAALDEGDPDASATFARYLPSAKGLGADRIRGAGFRLADAQWAIALQTGFASWPRLVRHIEQLRALEGTWAFDRLEIDGQETDVNPAARILIDGDRFRTESPGEDHEGTFNIDVETDPHGIDIEFVEGPEAGQANLGIFRLDGDRLDLCLDTSGRGRPAGFRTAPGTGHALETLRRASRARPADVSGGRAAPAVVPAGFELVRSPLLDAIQGEWVAVQMVRDGAQLPAQALTTGRRVARGNEVEVVVGGHRILHALVRLDEGARPPGIEYFHLAGTGRGTIQRGILRLEEGTVTFCMAAPGEPPPDDFTCRRGSGRTLSAWRPKGS